MSTNDKVEKEAKAELRYLEEKCAHGTTVAPVRAYIEQLERELAETKRDRDAMALLLNGSPFAPSSELAPVDTVIVLRKFLEATPCPNPECCDGSIRSTGPDPLDEPCPWCEEKHMILSGATRAEAVSARDADAKDAARYRWLRDGEKGQAFITAREERGRLVADADVDLDRYVDEYIERAGK